MLPVSMYDPAKYHIDLSHQPRSQVFQERNRVTYWTWFESSKSPHTQYVFFLHLDIEDTLEVQTRTQSPR